MKLKLSKEMENLGFIIIEPIIVRKKKISEIALMMQTNANTGTCWIPSMKKVFTMQPGAVRIFENDLSESLWCIEKRYLECECKLESDEEKIPFKQYVEEMDKIKKDIPTENKGSSLYIPNNKLKI